MTPNIGPDKEIKPYDLQYGMSFEESVEMLKKANDEEALQKGLGGETEAPEDGFKTQEDKGAKDVKEKAPKEETKEEASTLKKAGIFAGIASGIGAVAYGATKLLKLVPHPIVKAAGIAGGLVATALMTTSCADETTNMYSESHTDIGIGIKITIPKEDQTKLINAMKEGFDALLNKMDELGINMEKYGDQIIALLAQQGKYLDSIAVDLKKNNEDTQKIVEILSNMNSTVKTIEALVQSTNENIIINGQSIKTQLNDIINAIKKISGGSTLDQVNGNLVALQKLLLSVIDNQELGLELNKDTNLSIKDIRNILKNLPSDTTKLSQKLEDILKVLGSIEKISGDIKATLEELLNKVNERYDADDELYTLIIEINKKLESNNEQQRETNALINKFMSIYNSNSAEDMQALKDILNAINKNGNKIDKTNELLNNLIKVEEAGVSKEDIQKIINAINKNGNKIDVTNDLIGKLLEAQGKGDITKADLQKVIDAINKNGNKIDVTNDLIGKLLDAQGKGDITKADLQKVIDAINKNGNKIDVTNNLLTKLMDKVGQDTNNGGITKADLQKVIDAIVANGEKIDKTNELVNKYGAQVAVDLANIIQAIKNLDGNIKNVGNNLVNKIINNNSENVNKLLKAIANIKLPENQGGGVDQSKLEEILNELKNLVDLSKDNNKLIGDLNAKIDVLNKTTTTIKEKLEANHNEYKKYHKEVLTLLDGIKQEVKSNKYDDTELLAGIVNINAKLDKILEAIKNGTIKVTVDITGKVKCECNCGKPHEGILDNLEDILG